MGRRLIHSPLPPAPIRSKVAEHLPWSAATGNSCQWSALPGGRTNASWRLTGSGGEDAILKIYRRCGQNPLFPNNPDAEARLLTYLHSHRIAPKLVAHFNVEDVDCVLYHALPGRPWSEGVEDVAQLIQKLHKVTPPAGLRLTVSGADAIRDHAQAILRLAEETLDAPAAVAEASGAECLEPVLLHGDIVPGNLIRGAEDLRLIDWQCPAIGDPTEDLAVFLSPAMQLLYRGFPLSREEAAAFLGQFDEAQQSRYQSLAPVYHFRMAAYCLWQVKRGRAEYQQALAAELGVLSDG